MAAVGISRQEREQIIALAEAYPELTDSEISRRTTVSTPTVWRVRRSHGLESPKRKLKSGTKPSFATFDQIDAAYRRGFKARVTGDSRTGCPYSYRGNLALYCAWQGGYYDAGKE